MHAFVLLLLFLLTGHASLNRTFSRDGTARAYRLEELDREDLIPFRELRFNVREIDNADALVVITGLPRTIMQTLPSLKSSLILPNSPCHVLIAFEMPAKLHVKPGALLFVARELQRQLIWIANTTAHPQPPHIHPSTHREFFQVWVALGKVDPKRYRWLISVRSDIFTRLPINVRLLHGVGSTTDFEHAFNSFSNLTTRIVGHEVPPGLMVYYFLMASGQIGFVRRMLQPEAVVHYLPDWHWGRFPHRVNEPLRSALERLPPHLPLRSLQNFLANITHERKVSHVVGNTWLRFGEFEVVALAAKASYQGYGHMVDDPWRHEWEHWRKITESQLRLAYLTNGLTLIDTMPEQLDIDSVHNHDCGHVRPYRSNLNEFLKRSMCFIVRPCFIKHFNLDSTSLPPTVPLAECTGGQRTGCL